MTKISLTLLLLGACNGMFAMETTIKLPSQQEIAQRLSNLGMDHFTEKTKIDEILGDLERKPLQVYGAVGIALWNYDCLTQPQTATLTKRKAEIITAILQDHPAAIELLKEDGKL